MASIHKRGDKWLVYYRLTASPGQNAPQKTKTFADLKKAKLFANDMERRSIEGGHARNGRMPLVTLLNESLTLGKRQLKPATYARYQQLVEVQIVPAIGQEPIERIDHRFLTKYYASLLDGGRKDHKAGGLSASTVNAIQSIIRQAFQKAVLWKYLSSDPTAGVKRQSYRAGEMAVLNPKELAKLVDAARKPSARAREQQGLSTEPVFSSLVHFMAETGCRKGEALALRWSSVDLVRGQVALDRSVTEVKGKLFYRSPKNGERRTLSIKGQPRLIETLRSTRVRQAEAKLKLGRGYNQSDDLVFASLDGNAIRGETFGHAFAALVERTNIPRIRLHDLRHTHASILIHEGATPLEVSRRLGHKTVSVTMDTYAHLFPAQDERLSGTFARALDRENGSHELTDVVRDVVPNAVG